eukprot:gene6319-7571_t
MTLKTLSSSASQVAAANKNEYYPDEEDLNAFGVPYGFHAFDMNWRDHETFPVIIDINVDEERSQELVGYLMESQFLGLPIDTLQLQMLTYNGDNNLFTSIIFYMTADPAGTFYLTERIESIRTQWLLRGSDLFRVILEVAFVTIFAKSMYSEFVEMRDMQREYGTVAPYFHSIFNVIDMCAGLLTSMMIIVYIAMLAAMHEFDVDERYHVYESLSGYDETGEHVNWLKLYEDGENLSKLATKLADFNYILLLRRMYNFLTALTIIVTLLRVLKLMDFHPDIGMITRTIRHGGTDLLNFIALLGIILLMYTVMGHILYGGTSTSFHKVDNSFMTCFLMMLGDTAFSEDIPALGGTWERASGVIYFLTFMVIVSLFLLNALLGIIVNAMDGVKNEKLEQGEDQADIVTDLTALAKYGVKTAVTVSRNAINKDRTWEKAITESDIHQQVESWDAAMQHEADKLLGTDPNGSSLIKSLEGPKDKHDGEQAVQKTVLRMHESAVGIEEVEKALLQAVSRYGLHRTAQGQLCLRDNAAYADSADHAEEAACAISKAQEDQHCAKHLADKLMKAIGRDKDKVEEVIDATRRAEIEVSTQDYPVT